MHGANLTIKAPPAKSAQRVKNIRHQTPRTLQAFEHVTTTKVAAQHQSIHSFQQLGMSMHPHAWRHMRDLNQAFTEAMVVRQHKLAAGAYFLDRCRPNKCTGLIRYKETFLSPLQMH